MQQKQYVLTVTERQLTVIKSACEDYLRTRMGQFFDLASDISEAGKNEAMSNVEFEDMIARRNAAQELMISAFRIVQPVIENKTEQMLIAEDIYEVIKHVIWNERPAEEKERYRWSVDSHQPLHLSNEPLITVRRNDNGNHESM